MDSRIKISNDLDDLYFLIEAYKEAKKSFDVVRNKKIGSVIVKDKVIVGRGHRETIVLQENPYKDITFHAEHRAIIDAGGNVEGSTIYNLLEPCASRSILQGAWTPPPPCCQLIVEAKIKRIVFGIFDKNFGGGGAEYLLNHGVEVYFCELPNYEAIEKMTNGDGITRDDVIELNKNINFTKPNL
jgi:pyrimidine deaminase RibD-like protein